MEKILKDLIKRVEKLERAVYKNAEKKLTKSGDFKGATGGLRLLVSEGFFDRKRFFSEITAELGKRGYHYSCTSSDNFGHMG